MPRHRRRRPLLAAVMVSLLVTACSEDPARTATTRPRSTVEEVGVELPDPAVVDTGVTTVTTPAPAGTCTVDITGAVTGSWTGTAGDTGASYGPWISARHQEAAGESVAPVPDSYFVATCRAGGGRALTFTAAGPIPRRAAVYRFQAVKTGQSPDDLMQVLGSPDGNGLWTVSGDRGKLTIDAFDDRHVAGTFQLTITPLGGPSSTTASVSGSFDFANTTGA